MELSAIRVGQTFISVLIWLKILRLSEVAAIILSQIYD